MKATVGQRSNTKYCPFKMSNGYLAKEIGIIFPEPKMKYWECEKDDCGIWDQQAKGCSLKRGIK